MARLDFAAAFAPFRRNLADVATRWRRRVAPPGAAGIGSGARLALMAAVAAAVASAAWLLDDSSVGWAQNLPDLVRRFFATITDIGQSHWYLVPLGVAVAGLLLTDWRSAPRGPRLAWWSFGTLAAYAFAAVAGSGIVVNLLKVGFGRFRPPFHDQHGWLALDPLTFGHANASFPSGHSTTVGALAVIMCLLLPRLRLLWLALAALLLLSRVAVAAHYPSDVVAGFSLGAVIGYALARLMALRRVGFRFDTRGRLRSRGAAFRRLWRSAAGRRRLRAALWHGRLRWVRPRSA